MGPVYYRCAACPQLLLHLHCQVLGSTAQGLSDITVFKGEALLHVAGEESSGAGLWAWPARHPVPASGSNSSLSGVHKAKQLQHIYQLPVMALTQQCSR